MSSRSLNFYATWNNTLSCLGIAHATGTGLPTCVRCPLCDGPRLTIYDDTISLGAWHYCFDCKAHGDMIELAKKVWDVKTAVAIRRLTEGGCPFSAEVNTPERIDEYRNYYPRRRRKITTMWKTSAQYLMQCQEPKLRNLMVQFRLQSPLAAATWRDGAANLLGALGHHDIERGFKVTDTHGVSHRWIFSGPKWKDVLVIPHHDLPGRLSGFLFVGRNGRREDFVFKPIPLYTGQPVVKHEGGFACYWALEASRGILDNHVIVCGDPFLALRLQLRHFATSKKPLPLLAYCDRPNVQTQQAWCTIGMKTPVLWGWTLTASLVDQAIRANGNLAVTELRLGLNQERVDHFIRDNEPRDMLRRIVRHSLPWRKFLNEWSKKVEDGPIESLLIGLETYKVDMNQIADINQRFKRLVKRPKVGRSHYMGGVKVFERGGRWFGEGKRSEGGQQLVCNATFIIDRTVVEAGTPLYAGTLTHRGTKVPFTLPIGPGDPTKALSEALALAKPGAVLFIAPTWGPRLLQMAVLLSEDYSEPPVSA